jgi:hypothetical protein
VTGAAWHCRIDAAKRRIARYTGCPERNVPDFGRMFLKLNYTDITQKNYIRSWTLTENMTREKCVHLAFPHTVHVLCGTLPILLLSVVYSVTKSSAFTHQFRYQQLSLLQLLVWICRNVFCFFPRGISWHACFEWNLRRQCTCCCWRIRKAFSWPMDSV